MGIFKKLSVLKMNGKTPPVIHFTKPPEKEKVKKEKKNAKKG